MTKKATSLRAMLKAIREGEKGYPLEIETVDGKEEIAQEEDNRYLKGLLKDFETLFEVSIQLPPNRTHDLAIRLQA